VFGSVCAVMIATLVGSILEERLLRKAIQEEEKRRLEAGEVDEDYFDHDRAFLQAHWNDGIEPDHIPPPPPEPTREEKLDTFLQVAASGESAIQYANTMEEALPGETEELASESIEILASIRDAFGTKGTEELRALKADVKAEVSVLTKATVTPPRTDRESQATGPSPGDIIAASQADLPAVPAQRERRRSLNLDDGFDLNPVAEIGTESQTQTSRSSEASASGSMSTSQAGGVHASSRHQQQNHQVVETQNINPDLRRPPPKDLWTKSRGLEPPPQPSLRNMLPKVQLHVQVHPGLGEGLRQLRVQVQRPHPGLAEGLENL